jgi:CHAT domain-containing protein
LLSHQVLEAPLRVLAAGPGASRLIIVPSAGIEKIPIDMLPLPGADGQRVADRYLVTRAISLGALRQAMLRRPTTSQRVGFVARAGREARQEARAVGGIGARVLVGPKATRTAFLDLARTAELIHFGGHTTSADQRGGAALTFSGRAAADQVLRVGDVSHMRLDGATVVLLGCATASGRSEQPGGRTTVSLAEAFLRAGGNAVAASLWPIDDETARQMAGLLYGQGQAVPTAETLAAAKAQLRSWYPNEPQRWAGFVWYGPPSQAD